MCLYCDLKMIFAFVVKVRYEKHVTGKLSVSQEKELDVLCEMTMYVRDYLEDVPDTERKKENNAPRLSHFFLRKNVNAEQRRLIVGYIVRLGVSSIAITDFLLI